jgi:23S rRNA (pseudouridine1915-N3)-methyltransferase
MLKAKIYSVGKTKEAWLIEALQEYETRLKSTLAVEWILPKTEDQLEAFLIKEPYFICLDPKGKLMSSKAFSQFLQEQFVTHGSRLSFAIGGDMGFPPAVKARASSFLSLSPMTFTHQLTRLILVEQLYRALEIQKGSRYHK